MSDDLRHRNAERLDMLGQMLANLQAHIDQRAEEIAQPRIETVLRDAAASAELERNHWHTRLAEFQQAEQRAEDLAVELRRQLRALERNRDRYKERAELAEAAIARVRYLSNLTIGSSCRVQAIDQARDTLRELDSQDTDRG